MSSFLNKLFKRKENGDQTREMSVIPYPKRTPSAKKVRCFGRKSHCKNSTEGSVRANAIDNKRSHIADSDGREDNVGTEVHPAQHSKQPRDKNQAKKKLSLEDLKRISPPGYKEFEAAVTLKDLDEEIALKLWEDIFKPLSSHFEALQDPVFFPDSFLRFK